MFYNLVKPKSKGLTMANKYTKKQIKAMIERINTQGISTFKGKLVDAEMAAYFADISFVRELYKLGPSSIKYAHPDAIKELRNENPELLKDKVVARAAAISYLRYNGSVIIETGAWKDLPYLKEPKFVNDLISLDESYLRFVNANTVVNMLDNELVKNYLPTYMQSRSVDEAKVLLKLRGDLLANASYDTKIDKDAVFIAVSNFGLAIKDADAQYLSSDDHVFAALKNNFEVYKYVDKKYAINKQFANILIDGVKKAYLSKSPERKTAMENVRDFLEPLVYNHKLTALQFLNETTLDFNKFNKRMWADEEFCQRIVQAGWVTKNPEIVKKFRGEASKDVSIAKISVLDNYNAYKNLPRALRKNEDVLVAFASNYPDKYKTIKKHLKNINVATALVSADGTLLEIYRDHKIGKEDKIIESAIHENGAALEFAPKKYRKSEKAILDAVKTFKPGISTISGMRFKHPLEVAPKKFRNNAEVMLASVVEFPESFKLGSASIRNNKEIALEAVKRNPYMFRYASNKLQKDPELISLALEHTNNLKLLGDAFINDAKNEKLLINALDVNMSLYKEYPRKLQLNPKAIVKMMETYPNLAELLIVKDAHEDAILYRENPVIMKRLAQIDYEIYKKVASLGLQTDEKFAKSVEIYKNNKTQNLTPLSEIVKPSLEEVKLKEAEERKQKEKERAEDKEAKDAAKELERKMKEDEREEKRARKEEEREKQKLKENAKKSEEKLRRDIEKSQKLSEEELKELELDSTIVNTQKVEVKNKTENKTEEQRQP